MLRPVLLALALVSALATPGWAHVPDVRDAPDLSVPAAIEPSVPPPSAWLPESAEILSRASAPTPRPAAERILLAAFVTAAAVGVRSRRAVACTMALLLVTLAFESAVHSVHHLGSDADAARCTVASASTHLNGVLEKPLTVGLSRAPVEAMSSRAPCPARALPLSSVSARSPPLAASLHAVVTPRG